jgi:hypothetical protein
MSKRSASGSAAGKPVNRAFRLIFEQKGNKLKLTSVQRANMMAPPPQALLPERGVRGSWFELRDKQNRPVYRRVIENPLQDIEVVADDPERPLQRIRMDQPRGVFFLIVPDIAGVRRLALNLEARRTSAPAAGKRGKPAGKPPAPALYEFDFSDIDEKER